MLSGEAERPRRRALHAPSAARDFPGEHEVALPLRVDCLPTHEENCRVYRFLAAQLAGRREFGTYGPALRAA
jgi:hypothetical protein